MYAYLSIYLNSYYISEILLRKLNLNLSKIDLLARPLGYPIAFLLVFVRLRM